MNEVNTGGLKSGFLLFVFLFLPINLYAADSVEIPRLKQVEPAAEIRAGSVDLHFDRLNISTDGLMGWELLHSSVDSAAHYLLISLIYSSLPEGGRGRCSAGEEHSLIWIRLNENHEIKNSKEVVYSSCLLGLEIDQPEGLVPPLRKQDLTNGLRLESSYISSDVLLRIRYEITRPGDGLNISQHN
ncbi:MAG: hypothetical protein DIZ80_08180 [endosymbiont of Galathealinum brachiosum]|uniref:Uncharacterized protein n=1 Tax=endosymbiont of Galathealinum brachiosum TaxID=2200906 RepID=A0A370DHU2_9GAMM|nr:MAG: hypothetical protein DIZ80_08180 [endosymbiont of Galathealinum brachiosum]